MEKGGALVILLVSLSFQVFALENSLKVEEIKRFADVLQGTKYRSLEDAFYVVKALKALGKEVPAAEDVCSFASSNAGKDLKSVFQLSEIAKALSCKSILSSGASLVTSADENDVNSISYAIAASANFGIQVKDSLIKSLEAALKNDDSPSSAANAFYAASLLPKSANLKFLTDLVEDIIAQADEIDNSIMKFEGGLSVTSAIIRGALALADQQEKASVLSEDQLNKFAQYFLNRKYVMGVKSIHDVATALSKLAKNKFQIPIIVSVYKSDRLTDKNRMFKVRVTDVMDNSIPDAKVTAKSVTSSSGEVVAENIPLVNGPSDDYIIVSSDIAQGYIAAHSYIYDFGTTKRGIYTLNLNVGLKKDAKAYFGGKNVALKAKVLSRVVVDAAEIGVADRDQAASSKSAKVSFPGKLATDLEADYQQKIIMKFTLKDLSGSATTVHQAFIRMSNVATGQEIFFVAQAEDNVYKFTLDIGATGKDSFNNLSGKYKMDLIVGDELVQIPIKWNIATVSITFADEQKKSKKEMRLTSPQPEIQHMFRVPEKRPPILVSNIFTALIIVPILIMLAVWIKIGANVANFQFCISTVVFHIGLAGMFILYYMFWTRLNMFQTLKGLAMVGGATFLGGNKMLAAMAARKQNNFLQTASPTMYPDLSALLNLTSHEINKAGFILIEDDHVDGSFLLHHFISTFLKGDYNICIVGFSQTLVHYSSIGKKLGLNLIAAKENNQLVFIDGMSIFLKCLQDDDSSSTSVDSIDLKSLYDNLLSVLEKMRNKPTLLILDDVSMLINAGVSAEKVADFIHYCNNMAKSTGYEVCLLALLHCDSDTQDDDAIYLRNQLKYYAKIQFLVRGLETGYSKDVHGEVELKHRKPADLHIISTETKIMQFKLNEKGVNFFPLGTSSAVL